MPRVAWRLEFLCGILASAWWCNIAAAQSPAPSPSPAPAPIEIPRDGRVYRDLELITTNGDIVTFTSSEGPLNVRWGDLPEAVRTHFAKAYAESLARQQENIIDFLAETKRISGKIQDKLPQGLIVDWGGQIALLTAHPAQNKLAVNDQVDVRVRYAGSFRYTADGTTRNIRQFRVIGLAPQATPDSPEQGFERPLP